MTTRIDRLNALRAHHSDAEIATRHGITRQRVHALLGPRTTRLAKPGAHPLQPGSVAAVLKAWRRRLGLTQAVAAAALGVNPRTLAGWEQGRPCKPAGLILGAIQNPK